MIERLHQLLPALIELRRTLHRNPELAFQEEHTAHILANWFRQFPPDSIEWTEQFRANVTHPDAFALLEIGSRLFWQMIRCLELQE